MEFASEVLTEIENVCKIEFCRNLVFYIYIPAYFLLVLELEELIDCKFPVPSLPEEVGYDGRFAGLVSRSLLVPTAPGGASSQDTLHLGVGFI